MKDVRSLINFLFDSKEDETVRDEVLEMCSQIEAEKKMEVEKGPLKTALTALGFSFNDDQLRPEYGSVVIHLESGDEYQNLLTAVRSPDGMEALAAKGWVPIGGGDSGIEMDQEDYRIRFIEIDLQDEGPSDITKETDLDKLMKDVADYFSDDPDNPKPKESNSKKSKTAKRKSTGNSGSTNESRSRRSK